MGNLSGGNQQKIVIAKWLLNDPDIIILDEPTRGIDVGAKRDIYLLLGNLVRQGKAVIMISSEIPELMGICDRIMVMCEGNYERKESCKIADQRILHLRDFYCTGGGADLPEAQLHPACQPGQYSEAGLYQRHSGIRHDVRHHRGRL